MNRPALIISAAVILLAVIYTLFFRQKKAPVGVDGYFISTQSESNKRVEKLDLDKPSEDASYILDTNKLHIPAGRAESNNGEYKADPAHEWIIDIQPTAGGILTKEQAGQIFDKAWRKEYKGITLYGFTTKEKQWSYVDASDEYGPFEKLQAAVSPKIVYSGPSPNYDPQKLDGYLAAVKEKLKSLPFKVTAAEPAGDAITKAKKIAELNREFSKNAIIVLAADKPMSGRLVWDALICTGLKWGDGDLFHWENARMNYGDDQLFSVWTTTDPGYFLPEDIEKMSPRNLVFGFSVPRNADPENVYQAMFNAVKYCQKRLGGQILNQDGKPFDMEKEKAALAEMVKKLKDNGIVPGSDSALMNFE